jgi:hypothetical protein
MPEQIESLSLDDPLLCRFELSHRAIFYPLGFPMVVETNSRHVIEAAAQSWSHFEPVFDEAPAHVSLGVTEDTKACLPPEPVFRSREHLMSIVSDAENFIFCDFNRAFAFGWVNRSVAQDQAFLRYHFLDVAALILIQQLHLVPIHGALVERNGRGVVLCGESLAGKSTLAYACARAGWNFVADDATFLLRNRSDRYAIGNPHTIRFREGTRRLYPELARYNLATRPNGKVGIEAFTRDLPISTAPGSSVEHIVFLNRSGSAVARLEDYSKDHALNWFLQFAGYGESQVRAVQLDAYQRLLNAQVWQMRYGDLDGAVACLEQLVEANLEVQCR